MGYSLNSTCFLFPVASSKPLGGWVTVADNLTPLLKSESQTELLTLAGQCRATGALAMIDLPYVCHNLPYSSIRGDCFSLYRHCGVV